MDDDIGKLRQGDAQEIQQVRSQFGPEESFLTDGFLPQDDRRSENISSLAKRDGLVFHKGTSQVNKNTFNFK